MAPTPPSLDGTCRLLPTPRTDLLAVVVEAYERLASTYGPRNVLVLKRHPTGLDALAEALADAETSAGVPRSPRVESLPEHASKTIEEYDPTLDRLEYEERIELISLVIEGASRDVPDYLERAAAHESFARDVGQLLLEATRQRIRLDDLEDTDADAAPHDCLAFLYAVNDRFHDVLDDRGFVERADVIPRAVSLLEADADGVRSRVTDSFDAVLAVEFEEYRRLDRHYLATLTRDAELVCLGERHASVERTAVEPGTVDAIADAVGLDVESIDADSGARDRPPHAAITRFLATGDPPSTDATGEHRATETGRAYRIRTRTAREQVRAVAREIQSLRDRTDWSYDQIAVSVPRVELVPETRRRLREAGVPTATIGTPSLAEDPVVNELYAFVTLQCRRDRGAAIDAEAADDSLQRLEARVPSFTPALLEECAAASVERSLERWIRRTDLKGRIARDEEWVDAREQFASVRRVLEIARFVQETDLVAPDWQGLRRMLRRTIQYDAPYVHAVETQAPTGGVTVCAAGDLKYDSRKAVFLLDLIDDRYPGEQFLTRLFPQAWLRQMPTYPAVTAPSETEIASTFATAATEEGDPFETYHAQRARRRLALASRAAERALYCCSYERGSGGLRRTFDESRYLKLIDATPGLVLEDVDTGADAAIHGEAGAVDALLAEPRGELERILREASTGGRADLAESEALFEEIAVVLEAGDVDSDLSEAVRSQFEFAAGEVVRGE